VSEALVLSTRFVEAAQAGWPDADVAAGLARLDPGVPAALAQDAERTAFWLNVYNGAVRARLLADPDRYRRRWWFFARPVVTVAGRRLSPNAIEHGILRRSALLAGLGYLRNPWPPAHERAWRVARLDPRIHFALNCGAVSCPPLRAWTPTTLDVDLDRATAAYLHGETRQAPDGRSITVPRLLLWYRGDFGGSAGVIALLRQHGLVRDGEAPRLRYGTYDWTLDTGDGKRDG
jgi:hypothetical protein